MRIFYIFLIFIINICIVNAEIDIFKQEYSPKETFQAELNFEDLVEEIKSSDIVILNSASQPTNVGILLTKITKKRYFVYFDIPLLEEGAYTFIVNDVKYLQNSVLKKLRPTIHLRHASGSPDNYNRILHAKSRVSTVFNWIVAPAARRSQIPL
mgnify:CR=1 FL=1